MSSPRTCALQTLSLLSRSQIEELAPYCPCRICEIISKRSWFRYLTSFAWLDHSDRCYTCNGCIKSDLPFDDYVRVAMERYLNKLYDKVEEGLGTVICYPPIIR